MKNTLDIIIIEKRDDYEDSDAENPIQFGYFFIFIYLFFALYLLESRISSQNQASCAISISTSSFSSSSLSSSLSEDDKEKSSAPTQKQLVERAITNFFTPAPPDTLALEYPSPTRFAPVQIALSVTSLSILSRNLQKAMLAYQLFSLALKNQEISR